MNRTMLLAVTAALTVGLTGCGQGGKDGAVTLLNVSYDPTRELWKDLNEKFTAEYEKTTGVPVEIKQSHGGSGSQARAVIDGLKADVVTLALWPDTDKIRENKLIHDGWEARLPNRSLPYVSTIVFVVRQGNPKGIHDWQDLVKDGNVEIITPSPKTSGNGKLSFLAAWGAIITKGGTEAQAKEFVTKLYGQVPVLDPAARGATTTFAQKNIGDVHLTWENEAYHEIKEFPGLEIVYPKASFLAEPHVAVVDGNVDRKGPAARAAAEEYLKFLYTDEGQQIIGKHHYRPTQPGAIDKFPQLKKIDLFPITAFSGGWAEANKKFFGDGGVFDQIYQPKAK
ncbi:MAG: sulfate ABC transporter substrate-binding protein [Planctomycetia bacterium]|nr:sulfate ABC transporter substrate-binding protein [Planctomycetia bacterium]